MPDLPRPWPRDAERVDPPSERQPPNDELMMVSLCEAVGKQSDTIAAQADQIVELVRANMTLSRKLSELVTHS